MNAGLYVTLCYLLFLTLVSCQAGRRNRKGEGVKMAPPSKPEISRLSEDSVMVRWDVPINDGLAINFFKIQFRELEPRRDNPGPAWRTVDEDIAPHIHSYAVSGLKTGASYKFRIVAVYSNNDNRVGPKSNKYVLLKDPPMKRPSSGPFIHAAEAISQSAILLRWTYVEQDAVPVDGFFIHYRDTSSAGEYYKATSLGSNTRSHIITHLLPDTSYDIKMQCFNVAGTSNFSNIVTNKTWQTPEPSTTPHPPSPPVPHPTGHPHGNFPKILTPVSVAKFDQTFYLTIGISIVVLVLVFIVIGILCCNRRKDDASTASTSSQNIVPSSRKNKMKNERHPKANSLHNLHNGNHSSDSNRPDLFDNHYKVHHTNGFSHGHHLAKSMNGLTVKSGNSGFFSQGSDDEQLAENNFDIRIPLRRQVNEDHGGIRLSYEARSRTLASTSFLGSSHRSQSTRDILRKSTYSNSQHSLYNHHNQNTSHTNASNQVNRNNNMMNNNIDVNDTTSNSHQQNPHQQNPQQQNPHQQNPHQQNPHQQNPHQHFAGISTIERRKKIYNTDEVHPNASNFSGNVRIRSTSFTRLNGTLERNKKKSRPDLVSTPAPESALEDNVTMNDHDTRSNILVMNDHDTRSNILVMNDHDTRSNILVGGMSCEESNDPMMTMMMSGTNTWAGRSRNHDNNNHHHFVPSNHHVAPTAPISTSIGVSYNTRNFSGVHNNGNTINGTMNGNTINGTMNGTVNSHQPPRSTNGTGHFMMMQSSC